LLGDATLIGAMDTAVISFISLFGQEVFPARKKHKHAEVCWQAFFLRL
jgi:hypothetical protein